jgi:exodeoxyribonuclease VII large subunit
VSDGTLDLWQSALPEPIPPPREEIVPLTVGQLTRQIRAALEDRIGEVWVRGEISNLRNPGSGHLYFTLKDDDGLIACVMFRTAAGRLPIPLRDGLAVRLHGKITVYEARGQYQIQVDEVRPEGLGTLQERFEALKRKLMAEGLFDAERKRPLPVFPESVGIVTSLQGAVLQDFCRILGRRASGVRIRVRGVRVQGSGAAEEIAAAVAAFSEEGAQGGGVDLIVIARGGGSLEDLWAFNEEIVARALAASALPTISAVGHETDFTIADFVADLRAPTPSAAAELLSRDWAEWRAAVSACRDRMARAARQRLTWEKERWLRLSSHALFREPARVLAQLAQRIDDLRDDLGKGLRRAVADKRQDWETARHRWNAADPRAVITRRREQLGHWEARLKALGPDATLARGYAMVLDTEGKLIRRAAAIHPGQDLTVRLADGAVPVKSK